MCWWAAFWVSWMFLVDFTGILTYWVLCTGTLNERWWRSPELPQQSPHASNKATTSAQAEAWTKTSLTIALMCPSRRTAQVVEAIPSRMIKRQGTLNGQRAPSSFLLHFIARLCPTCQNRDHSLGAKILKSEQCYGQNTMWNSRGTQAGVLKWSWTLSDKVT